MNKEKQPLSRLLKMNQFLSIMKNMATTQVFDFDQAIAQAKEQLIVAQEKETAKAIAKLHEEEALVEESTQLVVKLKQELSILGLPSEELVLVPGEGRNYLPALEMSRYGVILTFSPTKTEYNEKHNHRFYKSWEEQEFEMKLDNIWSHKRVEVQKTTELAKLVRIAINAFGRGLLHKEQNDALVQASVEVEKEVEAKIAEIKSGRWTWPEGKSITLFQWSWQDGQTVEDGVANSTFDNGWALVDELDNSRRVQLMPVRYGSGQKGRLVKLMPESLPITIEVFHFSATDQLPSQLQEYPNKIRIHGYRKLNAYDANLQPITIYQRDSEETLSLYDDDGEGLTAPQPLEWVRDLVDRS